MIRLLKFNSRYFFLAVLLFIIEVLIALFAHDQFIRPYFGDVLVVILMYVAVKAFINASILVAAVSVLIFSFFIEGLQYIQIVNKLGLEHSPVLATVIGTSFSWYDILAYITGFILILLFEKIFRKRIV